MLLAGKPWKLRLYREGEAPVNVNVFPETEVARIVQYAHYKFKLGGSVDDLDVRYKGVQLPLYKSLKEAVRTYSYADASLDIPSFIKLEVIGEQTSTELSNGPSSASNDVNGLDLRYDSKVFGRYVNVDLQINTLSVDKLATVSVEKVDLQEDGIIKGLAQKAVDKLVEYERAEEDGKNLCGLNDTHSTSDLIGFLIKGNHIPFKFLHDLDPHCYDDLSLLDLLGVDLLPTDDTTITIMFNCVHEQKELTRSNDENEETIDDSDKLEFVSDAVLSIKFMKFNNETTVKDVKDFVRSVYTHTLHLDANDIKLVYKGRLMEDDNSKVIDTIEYGSVSNKIYKIHVQINQEFHEPSGPGFWNELFSNPNLFDFVSSTTRLNTPALTPTPTIDNLRSLSLQRGLSNLQSVTSNEGGTAKPELEFFTENEEKIKPMCGDLYVKCLIGDEGKEVFVNSKELSDKKAALEINGQVFELNEFDYDFNNDDMNVLNLSKNLIDRLQDSLDIEITRNMFTVAPAASTTTPSTPRSMSANSERSNEPGINIDRMRRRHRIRHGEGSGNRQANNHHTFRRQVVRYFGKFIALSLLIFRTIYFIGYNALIPIFILYEFSPVVPSKYSYVVIFLLLARAIWNTHEIWVMWSAYLQLNEVNEEKLAALEKHVEHRKLTRHYFNSVGQKEWTSLEKSIKRIIVEPAELQEIRNQLYEIAELIQPEEQTENNSNGNNDENAENSTEQHEQEQPNGEERVIPVEDQMRYLQEIFVRLGNEETEKSVEILDKMYTLLNAIIERYKVRRTRLVRNPPLKKLWDDFLILIWKDVKYVNPSPNFFTTVTEKIVRISEFASRPELFDGILEKVVPNPDTDNVIFAVFKNIALFFLLFFPFVKEKTLHILQVREIKRTKRSEEEKKEEEIREDVQEEVQEQEEIQEEVQETQETQENQSDEESQKSESNESNSEEIIHTSEEPQATGVALHME